MRQQITISNVPNQTINFSANGQNITMNINWIGYINLPTIVQDYINTYEPPNFFADIFLGNQSIITGSICIDRTPINLYASNFVGYLLFIDTLSNNNPNLATIGVSSLLYYIDDLSELANLTVSNFTTMVEI